MHSIHSYSGTSKACIGNGIVENEWEEDNKKCDAVVLSKVIKSGDMDYRDAYMKVNNRLVSPL